MITKSNLFLNFNITKMPTLQTLYYTKKNSIGPMGMMVINLFARPYTPCRKFSKFGLFLSVLVNSDWVLQWWPMRKNIF